MTLRSSLRWLVALAAVAAWAPTAAAQPTTIAAARAAGSGSTVTVQGTVSRALGDFAFIQDGTAGLAIRQTSGAFRDDVANGVIAPGTQLTVSGELSEFNGLLQLNEGNLTSYTVDGTAGVPAPQSVTAAQLNANGEDYESELIRISDVTFSDAGTFSASSNYDAADGTGTATVRIQGSEESEVVGEPIPSGTARVTGVGGQFDNSDPRTEGYQIVPVLAGDVESTGGGGGGGSGEILISELDSDTPSTDTAEFLELYNTTGSAIALDGYVLVLYNGSDDASYAALDLDGGTIPANGFYVICQDAANTANCDRDDLPGLQNGADAAALYLGDAAGFPDDTPPTTTDLVDAVVYGTSDADDTELLTGLGQSTQWDEDANGNKDNESIQRAPSAGSGSFEAAAPTPGVGPGAPPPPPPPPVVVTMAEARALPRGTPVTVTGTVSRAEGAFTYFQDNTAGLTIRQTSGAFEDDVEAGLIRQGTVLEVTGELSEFNNLVQINGSDLTSYTIQGQGAGPAVQTISFAEIENNGEAYEAEYVEVLDVVIQDDDKRLDASRNYVQRDASGAEGTIRVPSANDTRAEGTNVPFRGDYRGPLGQFSSSDPATGYQLLIIDPADVRASGGPTLPPPPDAQSFADARAAGDGTEVVVVGTVTRAEGDFLYLQDDTAGLTIRQTSGALNAAIADGTVEPGTVLRVQGELSSFNGLLQINGGDLTSFAIEGTAAVPAPQTITRAELSADGEAYESELIRIVDATIDPNGDDEFAARTNYLFADGTGGDAVLRVPNADDTEVDGLTIPTDPTTLTGIAGQFASSGTGGYQLLVIEEGDVADATSGGGGGGGGGEAVTIAEARAAGVGETVTIEGTVTRARGDFLYLQDDTAGLTIRQTEGAFFEAVADGTIAPGTTLSVTGTLSEFRELLQINEDNLAAYTVTGTADVPAPQVVTLDELATNGEAYEAELVRIDGLSLQGAGLFEERTNYGASDGSGANGVVVVRVPNADDTTVDGTPIPDAPASYVGIVGQFDSEGTGDVGYQLLLIEADDVAVGGATAGEAGPDAGLAIEVANPVRGAATVTIATGAATTATLAVYDALGRQVAVLADGPARGDATATFDAGRLAPGVYVLHLRTEVGTVARPVTVVR